MRLIIQYLIGLFAVSEVLTKQEPTETPKVRRYSGNSHQRRIQRRREG